MKNSDRDLRRASGDVPDRLGVKHDFARPKAVAARVLIGLVLLSLMPRLAAAWKLGPLAADSYYYLSIADSLDKGDPKVAFSYLRLNIYPVILVQLHRLGLDWVVAGKLWGALNGGLLVLPLFGWVRRLFDDRIAVIACFLYAINPELIELSVEPVRESTFWFLFTLSLYLQWRSLNERRLWLFALAGISTAAAVHTRSEGWLLLLPLAIWTIVVWRKREPGRWKLAVGIPLSFAMTPLLIIAFNVTVLRSQPNWEWGRLRHFAIGYQWMSSLGPRADAASAEADELGITARASHYFKRLVHSLGPLNFLFLVIGLVRGRRLFRQGDKFALLLVGIAVMLAVWMRQWESGSMNGRWFSTILLVLVPFESLGVLAIADRLARRSPSMTNERLKSLAIGACVLLALIAGTDVATTTHSSRRSQGVAGDWLHEELGPFESVVVNQGAERIGYYAGGDIPETLPRIAELPQTIRRLAPDLVVLREGNGVLPSEFATACAQCERLGLTPVAVPNLDDRFVVFSRTPRSRATQIGGNNQSGARRQ